MMKMKSRGSYVCSVRKKYVVYIILTIDRFGPGDDREVLGDVDSLTMCQRRGQIEQSTS